LEQTGRSFGIRFKEHISDIKCNREKQVIRNILNTGHERAQDIMSLEVAETHPKSQYLSTLER